MTLQINFEKLNPDAKLPTKAYQSDHCWDFYTTEDIELLSGETRAISLGLKIELPPDYALVFEERSGLALKGLIVGGGIIDESYRGELKAIIRYLPKHLISHTFILPKGSKIIQGHLEKTIQANWNEISRVGITHRNDKGFGSTDGDQR